MSVFHIQLACQGKRTKRERRGKRREIKQELYHENYCWRHSDCRGRNSRSHNIISTFQVIILIYIFISQLHQIIIEGFSFSFFLQIRNSKLSIGDIWRFKGHRICNNNMAQWMEGFGCYWNWRLSPPTTLHFLSSVITDWLYLY